MNHHKVKITDSALYMAVDLADRYIKIDICQIKLLI